MLLLAGLGFVLQVVQPAPAGRADSIARDAERRANDRASRPSQRRPVTAEHLATAYKDALAKELLLRARRARLSQDSALTGYDASSYQRLSASLGFSKLGRDRLVFRTERADRVRWKRDVGLWIDVKGARTAMPGLPDEASKEAGADLSQEGDMAPVPYYPGYEPLWIGVNPAGESVMDENGPVHPLAEGSEAYYTYRTGDSITMRPEGVRVIRLRELQVRPREPKWNVVVGSLWFDLESGQLVRAAYRFAVPMHIDAFVREQDPNAFKDVPLWIKPALFPMYGEVKAITIEYGMYGGRFWLPRARSVEGVGQASFVRVPFKMEQSFTYASVNGTDPMPPMPALPPARATPPDSLTREARQAWLDSARAVRVATARARRDSIRQGTLRPIAQCDTSAFTVATARQFGNTRVRVATRTPCDLSVLATSPDLPTSIFDPGDELFDLKARDALIAEALAMGVQPPFMLNPRMLPRPTVAYGLQLVRYNRIEGLSAGLGVSQVLGGGYTADVVGRFGLADKEPNLEVGLTRSNLTRSFSVSAYNHLVQAGDWGNPLSFGASLSGALFGRDEGFYYRASGVELRGRTERAAPVEWRFFVERQRSAAAETQFSLMGKNSAPNIVATTGTYPGIALRMRHWRGQDPRALRVFSDLRLEAAGGDSTFGRGALDVTFTEDFGSLAAALTLSGGSSIGSLPVQRKWYLGGTHTVRGQTPDTAANGSAYWLARAEFGRTIQGTRPVVFGDFGWVGDRARVRAVGVPMSGVGVGVSMLDGLIRFDAARGLNPRRQWRVDMYVEAVF